ncbi:MAG: hypothetical protein KJ871_09225 [Alphaproteobacteria bacterium]|nr:hypothetical protein [Alphaproteobacteria bacterium]MBU2084162.1 hypothetical protein [Alphaproteobacteria bacterium]MBU2144303.1 hypothetical protein [Alphaproteobacteria bacterium]MBU2196439.1 hypothetical protein [Alphaproteobacteria bacterium]
MTHTRNFMHIVLLSAGLLLVACGKQEPLPAPDGEAQLDSGDTGAFTTDEAELQAKIIPEFETAAANGQMDAALFLALFRLRPETETVFLETAAQARREGATYTEAGRAGGDAIRPVLIEESNKAMLRATDQQASDFAEVTLKEFREFETTAVQDCARTAIGLSPLLTSDRLAELRNAESAITVDILNAPDQGGFRVTPIEDVQTWMGDVFRDKPAAGTGATYIGTPDPTDEQAMAICNTMITIYEELGKLPLARRAAYMRGMSAG